MSSDTSGDTILIDGHWPGSVLFRVHDDASASPHFATDFHATSPHFLDVKSGTAWRKSFNHMYFDNDMRKSDTWRNEMIRHILGGWSGYSNEYQARSDWISASRSFDWAVWEIARRLERLNMGELTLSLIANHRSYASNYRGSRMIIEDAVEAIEEYGQDYGLSRDERSALNFARASEEVLICGRIFEKDIVCDTEWTNEEPGYCPRQLFMEAFFLPRKYWRGGWLNNLVWDPARDSSREAINKIANRREQLASSRAPSRR